jgi:DNA-binding response OmpR family regulator
MVGSFSAGKVALFLHTPATGGTLVLGAHCCRLTPIQFALLELLLKQLREDESKHDSIKGFVSSSVLLGSLPWDAAHPDLTNLKQLVRRLRRRLEGHGVVLDSCCGLGYRLLLTAGAPPAL